METKVKRKYVKRGDEVANYRLAKCGHMSKLGRYFKCESCLEELPSDDGDLIYHQIDDEFEEIA